VRDERGRSREVKRGTEREWEEKRERERNRTRKRPTQYKDITRDDVIIISGTNKRDEISWLKLLGTNRRPFTVTVDIDGVWFNYEMRGRGRRRDG